MDERRLTAWLITEGVLTSDQVKHTLEEQIRLQRSGTTLDVVGMARRLKLLTDEQVLTVIERTGYRPANDPTAGERKEPVKLTAPDERDKVKLTAPAADPSASEVSATSTEAAASNESRASEASASASASASDASAASLPSEIAQFAAKPAATRTDEVVVPLGAGAKLPAGEPAEAGEAGSGSRKRGGRTSSGARGAGHYHPRGKAAGTPAALVIGGVFTLAVALGVLVASSGGSGHGPGGGGDGPRGSSGTPSVSDAGVALTLQDLQSGLTRLEHGDDGDRDRTIRSLRALVLRLRASALTASQKGALDDAEDRLAVLTDNRAPTPPPLSGQRGQDTEWVKGEGQRVEGARVEQAWTDLANDFERILWLCLSQPRSPLQQCAESVRNVDLRSQVRASLQEHTAKGPDGIASLVASEDLHPVLGVGGYDALLREARSFPDDLKESERWKKWQTIIPRFSSLRERAAAYATALRLAEDACARGALPEARKCFVDGPYKDDPWWDACRKVLDQPDVIAALAARAREVAEGGAPSRRDVPLPGRGGQTTAQSGQGWKDRFLALAGQYRRGSDADKPAIGAELVKLLGETLGLSKQSFDTCAEVVGVYDANPAVFKAEATLGPPLREHHTLYFEGAFARASGPLSFRDLDHWCETHGYDAWRARLKPYLRLLAGAASPMARQREGQRRARAQTQDQVEAFAKERVGQVEAGIGQVVAWMRQRGFASPAAKTELTDLIGRAIERAGNPVAGARLKDDVGALEHKAEGEAAQQLEKDYRKQVDLMIGEAVSKSLKGVERCLAAGEPGLAFDLFSYVLLLDPQNDKAHKGLGHVEVDGKWLRRFEAEKLKQGIAWDPAKGWVKAAEKARYDKGEYWDPQRDTWTTIADANRLHADPNNPWTVQTEHFMLRSTSDLPVTVTIATRLEAFYLSLFRQYDLFFAPRGSGGGAAVIFGVSPSQQQPLLVNFYRDEAQFRANAHPPTGWAAGFYSSGPHASFFYDMGNAYSVTVLQHEIVHQILGESSPGGGESWLAEGSAVYLEDAFFRDGVLTLGGERDHSRVVAYEQGVRAKNPVEHTLTSIMKLRTSADWDTGDISANYRGAGAAVYFFCNFDDGRYRSDFVDYLHDAYYGRNPKLEDYFGLSQQTLDVLMHRFYDPSAAVDLPGGGASASQADLESARDALVNTCGARDVDVDQLSQAYGLLRAALQAVAGKDADAARSRAERALLAMRKKQVKVVEAAAKREQTGGNRTQRYAELQRLRADALAIIRDVSRYPDEDHGRVGQPAVDEKVNALRRVWQSRPAALDEPEVVKALELLEVSEPWLAELEVEPKKIGDETAAAMRRSLDEAASAVGLDATADAARIERDRKVREWNDGLTQLPAEIRDQVRILNDYRAMLGLHALAIDERLCRAAAKHSAYMEQTGTFDHNVNNPGRRTPTERCQAEGYTEGVGENIAFGYPSAQSVHDGWYNSSGHHRNMVLATYYQIGVGRSGTYWTQDFGNGKPTLP